MLKSDIVSKIQEVHGNRYTYPEPFVDMNLETKIDIICSVHGAFKQSLTRHLQGRGCQACGGSAKLDTASWVAACAEKHNNKYDYSKSVYVDSKTPIIVICPEHGEFLTTPAHHKAGRGCAKCANVGKSDTKEFVKKARRVHGVKYIYDKTLYNLAREKVTITCPEHGDFLQTPNDHLSGNGCPRCGIETRRLNSRSNLGMFKHLAFGTHGDRYDYTDTVYITAKDKLAIRCKQHGIFWQLPNNHIYGFGCPDCGRERTIQGRVNQPSKAEHLLREAFPKAEAHNRKVLSGQEIDLMITPTLGVEVNGVYWHTELNGKDKNYHISKTKRALEHGVELLHFTDQEVLSKTDLVVSMIKHKTGEQAARIFARKCELQRLPREQADEFCNTHHMQGAASSSVRYGLYYEGELVAVMTFAKPRFTKGYEWELVRFAVKQGVSVVGGASKLFKHFTKHHIGNVVSYANMRWSQGKLYETLGFAETHISAPSYVWARGATLLSRYQCQKHKLHQLLGEKFNPELSESQNMESAGYSRLWDCGNKVYGYTPH